MAACDAGEVNVWSFDAPIETERLVLRPFRADDLDDVVAFHHDPEVQRFTPWSARTRDETAGALAEWVLRVAAAAPGDVIDYGIEERASGSVIGSVIVFRGIDGGAEVGYALRRDRWGLGLASEAVAAMLAAAETAFGVTHWSARIERGNEASIRLIERLGFTREGEPGAGPLRFMRPAANP